MPAPSAAQIRTLAPDGTRPRWCGQDGQVVSVRHSTALPGGPDQLSFTVQSSPDRRPPSLAVGRQVTVFAGPRPVWDGQLDEPVPGEGGWAVTAHGAGTFGRQFNATWGTGVWDSGRPNVIVNDAISRGLRWVNGGSLNPLPTGAWLGQAPANGSIKVDDMLNLVCSRGGLTWRVRTVARGNVLEVIPLPTVVTRLLVASGPVARTYAQTVSAAALRYESSGGATPAYGTTWVTDDDLIASYGRAEDFIDLSDAGVDASGTQAQGVGAKVLARYQQAAFADPFTVAPGQYLTTNGTPVSLACERAGEVVRLLAADYGGQVSAGLPVTFIAGGYEYDEDTGTAQVTAFGSVRLDFSSLVARYTTYRTPGDPFGLKA